MSDATRILSQIESGDPSAAVQLLPLSNHLHLGQIFTVSQRIETIARSVGLAVVLGCRAHLLRGMP